MLIQRKGKVSSWNQEKLHKEGSGDKDVLKTTDNGFVKDKKLGVGEELWAKNIKRRHRSQNVHQSLFINIQILGLF